MKRTTKIALLGSAVVCGSVASDSALAGGLSLYEIGTPDVGLASAGYSARAQEWRFGLGAPWQVSEKITLGAAYEFGWGGDMTVDQGSSPSLRGRVAGAWENVAFNFFTLNMTWKF